MNDFFKKIPFIDNVLKGVGQIMLQENRWTGLLFLVGIFIGSWQCGVATILATVTGTYVAMLLKYDKSEIDAGLYGFSAALVGVALTFIFQATILIWVLVIVGGALATIIQHFFIKKNIPVFTLPFILITWIFVFILHQFTQIPPSDVISAEVEPAFDQFFTYTNSFGEVIFQGAIISGVLFLIAVFIGSPAAALYGFFGSALSAYISHIYGEPLDKISMGLFGFNAILSAIVFSGFKKSDGIWVVVAVVITALINDFLVDNRIFDIFGGVFTFPFVAGTWITLLIQKIMPKKIENT
ncbi:MAG: urea transporter [Flavobacteriales bacterium]